MKTIHVLMAGLLVLGSAQITSVRGQSGGLASLITQARQANATLLKQYSWQSRTELIEKEKTIDTRIESVSYGPDGTLQRTVLNDESSGLPRGLVRRRIADKKKE